MSVKRKWLRAVFLVMLAVASFGSLMNPREIEDLLHMMNKTRVEFTIPDEDNNGGRGPDDYRSLIAVQERDSSGSRAARKPEEAME